MNLDWLFPWRRPRPESKPMMVVAEIETARHAAETHGVVSNDAREHAIHAIEKQGDRGGFLAQLIITSHDLRALTSTTLDRTRK